MASACVNNSISMSPDNFPPPPTCPSYGWLSPRISFSREDDAAAASAAAAKPSASSSPSKTAPSVSFSSDPPPEIQDPPVDFEFFRLEDHPVSTMLPADQLFSDGKLVPLQITHVKPSPSSSANALADTRSPEPVKPRRRTAKEVSARTSDPNLFSPKAPKCSSRWRELLGLKKLYQQNNPSSSSSSSSNPKSETHKAASTACSSSSSSSTSSNYSNHANPTSKSLKHFLHRNSKYCSCNAALDHHSLSQPLLKDSDCESVSISSSRLSLSSSSSSHEHEDLPRLSLDSDKPNPLIQNPNPNPFVLNRSPNPPRMKLVKPRSEIENHHNHNHHRKSPMRKAAAPAAAETCSSAACGVASRGVSVDSPRMNSSGKIVFQSLERSSSSPSSFSGGPRFKQRGMERSYSANVRVTPVLNVPVCSLRGSSKSVSVFGFGQLFSSSPQKKDSSNSKSHQQQQQLHHQQQQQQQQPSSCNRK